MSSLSRAIVLVLLAVAVLLTGCAGTLVLNGEYDITRYFPFDAGNLWTYRTVSTGQQWTALVEARGSFAGELAYPLRYSEAADVEYNFFRPRSNGLYYLGWYDDTTDTTYVLDPVVLFPNDLSENEPWVVSSLLYADGTPLGPITYRFVIRGLDRVTVPAGTFSRALRVEQYMSGAGISQSETWWYVKDVGPIKISSTGRTDVLVDSNLLR